MQETIFYCGSDVVADQLKLGGAKEIRRFDWLQKPCGEGFPKELQAEFKKTEFQSRVLVMESVPADQRLKDKIKNGQFVISPLKHLYHLKDPEYIKQIKEQAAQKLRFHEHTLHMEFGFDSPRTVRNSGRPIQTEWIIQSLIQANSPLLILGPSKAMKTSVAMDMAVSIASGKPFLGHEIPQPRRVLYVLGEGEVAGNRSILKRVLDSKEAPDETPIFMTQKIRRLDQDNQMMKLKSAIKRSGATFVIIDPAYLFLSAEQTGVVSAQGEMLREVNAACRTNGATLAIVHHLSGSWAKKSYLSAQDAAGAGYGEFAGQWLLLTPQRQYKGDGKHQLRAVIGGRGGQSFDTPLYIDEGQISEDGIDDRTWNISTLPFNFDEASKELLEQLEDEGPQTALQLKCGSKNSNRKLTLDLMVEQGTVEKTGKGAGLVYLLPGQEVTSNYESGYLEALSEGPKSKRELGIQTPAQNEAFDNLIKEGLIVRSNRKWVAA